MTATLLVFLKHPTPGRVKTRLAAVIGAEAAARLYAQWITQVLEQLQPVRHQIRLVGCHAGAEAAAFAPWQPLADAWWPQAEGGLGERLAAGFRVAHESGGPVGAIGTDCLEITADLIMETFAALQKHDAVFGPALDGGYYLVGTSHWLEGFFDGIRWSSPHTLADSLARCRQHGWSTHLLPPRQDIDTWEDWQVFCRRSSAGASSSC